MWKKKWNFYFLFGFSKRVQIFDFIFFHCLDFLLLLRIGFYLHLHLSKWMKKKNTKTISNNFEWISLFFLLPFCHCYVYSWKTTKKNKSRSELRRETKSEKFEERKCAHNRWVKSLDKYRVSLHLRWSEYSMACDIFSTLNHCRRTKKMQSYFSLWNLR